MPCPAGGVGSRDRLVVSSRGAGSAVMACVEDRLPRPKLGKPKRDSLPDELALGGEEGDVGGIELDGSGFSPRPLWPLRMLVLLLTLRNERPDRADRAGETGFGRSSSSGGSSTSSMAGRQ